MVLAGGGEEQSLQKLSRPMFSLYNKTDILIYKARNNQKNCDFGETVEEKKILPLLERQRYIINLITTIGGKAGALVKVTPLRLRNIGHA